MTQKKHIMKSFDQELAQLKKTVIEMINMAERQVANSLEALATNNEVLAARTIANDVKVNRMQGAVDDCTLRLLAMRQPMASDLRFIIASDRMADDLERIADYAVGIAKRSLSNPQMELGDPVENLQLMGKISLDMLAKAKTAYQSRDLELTVELWHQDDLIDEQYTEAIKELQLIMAEDSECIEPCMALLNAAKAIERIGDHATNLAEEIYFFITGEKLFAKVEKRNSQDDPA